MEIHGISDKTSQTPGTMTFYDERRYESTRFDFKTLRIKTVIREDAADHGRRLCNYLAKMPFGVTDQDPPGGGYADKMAKEGPWLFVSGWLGTTQLGYMWLDPMDGRSAQLHIVRSRARVPRKAYLDIARMFMMECFNLLQLHRLTVVICMDDYNSLGGAEQLGFDHEGTIREALWFEGKPQDVCIYGLLGRDFKWRP